MTDKNFFTSLPYLILVSLTTLVFWTLGMEMIGISIFLVAGFFILIFVKNSIYIIPLFLNAMFMVSQTEWDLTVIPIYAYLTPIVLIIGVIIHVIRFKVNVFKGQFFLGIALLGLAVIASTLINTEAFDLTTLAIIIASIFVVLIYGFFANTISGDNTLYLIKIFVILGVLIALQVGIFYIKEYIATGDIHHALENKTIDIGWGISNFIATYLIMFISALTYFIKKYKLHIFWILVGFFEVAMLLFTLSRAGIIAFALTSVLLIMFMFFKYEHKFNLFINLVIGLLIVSIIGYFTREYFITIWDRLALLGLDDTGRIKIWYNAIDVFKANPIFGAGVFARVAEENGLRMFHNTLLHTLASFGVIGGIALLVQFISIIKVFFYKLTQEKAILLIALIGVNIHGMVDNVYYMPHYMIIMFITIAVVENTNKIDKLREELISR
ncbi:O-antigen ligase family protein [Mycoplasmatota bacterium WC30]